ncbi:putative transporter [Chytriomyces sp. MP71]|nr:putative transporter [Chytriomyces sp. MP71]
MNAFFIIAATCFGTLVEWYDFYVYLFLQSTLATQLYAGTPASATISWLATYAIGFLVRPIGAILFGSLGDIYGRKTVFLAALLLMGLATTLCGCLPTISMVGPSAGAGIIILRVLQGLALGGEYGGAIAYICEHAPKEQHGHYSSVLQVMAPLGVALALLVCFIFRSAMGDASFTSYGWRFPFLFSFFLIGGSLWARCRLLESPVYADARQNDQTSKTLADYFKKLSSRNTLGQLAIAIIANAGCGVLAQVSLAYSQTFILNTKVPLMDAYKICLVPFFLACPVFGVSASLSDKFGRKSLILLGIALGAILCYPCFLGMYNFSPVYPDKYNPAMMSFCLWILLLCTGIAFGPLAAFLAEFFPTRLRFLGSAAGYHLGFGIFGGIQPVVTAQINASTGSVFGGLIYPITVAGLCAILGLFFLPETRGRALTLEVVTEILKPALADAKVDVSQQDETTFTAST